MPHFVKNGLEDKWRSAAIPTEAKARQNPVPATDLTLHEGMEHFADHRPHGRRVEQLGARPLHRHLPKLTGQEIEKMKKMNPQPAVKPHKH